MAENRENENDKVIEVGYYHYNVSDRVRLCPKGDWLYNDPSWLSLLDLTEQQKLDAEVSLWGLAYCPIHGIIEVWTKP